MFTTIVAGVSVFVLGQFVLKLVLEPVVSFKEAMGNLSAFFLRNRAAITNFNATKEQQNELRLLVSTLLSKKEAIPAYVFVAKVLNLTSEDSLLEGCRVINGIAYEMNSQTAMKRELEGAINILFELNKASSLLKIRLDYSDL